MTDPDGILLVRVFLLLYICFSLFLVLFNTGQCFLRFRFALATAFAVPQPVS
jgi:hypothetical protein